MSDTTTGRLLRLLSLLHAGPDWSGTRLAERLGVTTRTVRRDVERLRELGYPVHATLGPEGGYRLGGGAALPPLLLDEEEALATVVALRGATSVGVADDAATRSLAKVREMLPGRLRHRIGALDAAVVPFPTDAAATDLDLLVSVAAAIEAPHRLRFDYVDHHGQSSRREVEPHRLVSLGATWYLVGWDVDREDWRIFRLDRVAPRIPNGPRFTHREPPHGDVLDFLRARLGFDMWPYRCRVRVHRPAAEVAQHVTGIVSPLDDRSCLLELACDSIELAVLAVGMLGADFDVESPPELVEHLRTLSARFSRAALGSATA